YQLEVDNPANSPTDSYSFSVNWGVGTTQRFSGANGLVVNHSYSGYGTFSISASAVDRTTGNFDTGTLSVRITLAAPVMTAPAGTVPSPVTVSWQAVTGATSYELRLDDLTSHVSYADWQTGLTSTSYQPASLTPLHSYRVWVHGVNAQSSGQWSASNFSVAS